MAVSDERWPMYITKPGEEEPDHCLHMPCVSFGMRLRPEAQAMWDKMYGRMKHCAICGCFTAHFDDGCRDCNEAMVVDYTKGDKPQLK